MADKDDLVDFPGVSKKIAAPTKKSVFERQRAEAEAKRVRDEREAAAIYDDFVKSFDDEGVQQASAFPGPGARRSGPGSLDPPPMAPTGPGRRHFGLGMKKSGPGTLGPDPSSGFKREYDGARAESRFKQEDRGIFAYEDAPSGPIDTKTAFQMDEDDDVKSTDIKDIKAAERAAARPTVHLSQLPPSTSPAVIKALIPTNLTVEAVRILPPTGSTTTERRSMSAIVTFASETAASDIDTAVSALQNKYLGYGFNLAISRHLSSAALGGPNAAIIANSASTSQPFGARTKAVAPGPSLSRAPPPGMQRGFAPPVSYDVNAYSNNGPSYEVQITPPSDIRELKLIHKTVESVLKHGPEFESLLMSRPEVQREEKWAWLWDSRSQGGVWYRWRLWQILSGTTAESRHSAGGQTHRLFTGGAPWIEPETNLRFEFATDLPELISGSDYDSSEEDDSDDDDNPRKRRRQMMHASGGPAVKDVLAIGNEEHSYLNPLQKAKITHLLSRLPNTTARLRRGDVARVTAFAISHASQGAAEVVDMLVTNILRPFAWSKTANPDLDTTTDNNITSTAQPTRSATDTPEPSASQTPQQPQDDTTSSTLIALYLISDILSASSTSGVRHAWRYRSLFENALLSRRIFPRLGRLEKDFNWGRLRAEKWKRSIMGLLSLWEGWGVFMGETHARFVSEFEKPPLSEKERIEEEKRKEEEKKSKMGKKGWKTVNVGEEVNVADVRTATGASKNTPAAARKIDAMDVDTPTPREPVQSNSAFGPSGYNDPRPVYQPGSNVPIGYNESQSLEDGSKASKYGSVVASGVAPARLELPKKVVPEVMAAAPADTSTGPPRKKRMRAEDMFADDDGGQ